MTETRYDWIGGRYKITNYSGSCEVTAAMLLAALHKLGVQANESFKPKATPIEGGGYIGMSWTEETK